MFFQIAKFFDNLFSFNSIDNGFDWGYRTVCKSCKIIEGEKHLDNSNFWSKMPCARCGGKQETVNCRMTKIGPEFK